MSRRAAATRRTAGDRPRCVRRGARIVRPLALAAAAGRLRLLAIGAVVAYLRAARLASRKGPSGGGGPARRSRSRRRRRTTRTGRARERRRRALATDGIEATSWQTENYKASFAACTRPASASCSTPASRCVCTGSTVTTTTPGFTAEIKAGDSPGGPFPVISGVADRGRQTRFDTTQRYVPVLRALDHALKPPGTGSASVNEIVAR